MPTVDGRLIGLDIGDGKPIAGFGDNGVVDLKTGMGEVKPGYYQQTSTPLVAGNLVIVGGRVADNNEIGEPLADIVEKPVPAGNVQGERYSPTQPYSDGMPQIGNATLTEADMWGAPPLTK
ncbi:MAG: hypothetical protein QM682_18085 [Paracoccus sp. (in: a-proteobacteria)]|uniref:hypothetical protein n=1 Tax=Paracoccus sp. TaxID=267 RepID=UPI0039E411C1